MAYTRWIMFTQWESVLRFSNQPGPREHSREVRGGDTHSRGILPGVLIMNLSKSGASLIVASEQLFKGSQD